MRINILFPPSVRLTTRELQKTHKNDDDDDDDDDMGTNIHKVISDTCYIAHITSYQSKFIISIEIKFQQDDYTQQQDETPILRV